MRPRLSASRSAVLHVLAGVALVTFCASPSSAPRLAAQTAEAQTLTSHVPGVQCVAVQPLGDPSADEVAAVATGLAEFYGFQTITMDPVALPEAAWYAPRHRWRAERLLEFLTPRLPAGCDRIIGVTDQDISTTKGEHEDWGILGLGDMPGTAAVVSSFRCQRHLVDVPVLERLRRVAVHELGHTLGLPHCPTTGCFLEDAGGTVDTVDRETFLCEICRARIGWRD